MAGRMRKVRPVSLIANVTANQNASDFDLEAVAAAARRRTDPMCLADTGLKCATRDDCKQIQSGTQRFGYQTSGCSNDGRCLCLQGGCADATKSCGNKKSKWQETELKIAPVQAPNYFMMMKQSGGGAPELRVGHPAPNEPESLWLFLLQPDKKSMLLTTKQSRFLDDGFVLDLPPAPWDEDKEIAPIQAKLKSAGQAEWQIEQAPTQNWRLRHVASDRYLMVKVDKPIAVNKNHAVPQKRKMPKLTTCAPKKCTALEADFDLWPHTEHPFVKPKYNLPRAPWHPQ